MAEQDSMHVPIAFREEDPATLFDIIERYSFAPLLTCSSDGLAISHVPFHALRDRGAHGSLFGHLARSNPHWKILACNPHALCIFTGPHAYVSPCWYAPNPENVPTWNYVVVHVSGCARLLEADETKQILKIQAEAQEARNGTTHRIRVDDPVFDRVARGVVGFEIEITQLTGKFKLSQTRSEHDRLNVIEHLAANADPLVRELAALMERRETSPAG